MTPYPDLEDSELATLLAFADGTLENRADQAAIARRVAASAELTALVDEQRAVAARIRAAVETLRGIERSQRGLLG